MKKYAFSYLEIVIAMILVAMVAALTAPFMTDLAKKQVPVFGEYKCYARYMIPEGEKEARWVLFQNQRNNEEYYMAEDAELQSDANCEFKRPNEDISQYTITIYGGGASGSVTYFDSVRNESIYLAAGGKGENGEEKTKTDTLEKAFVEDILTIGICDNKNQSNIACIGKGGDVNTEKDGASSMVPKERLKSVKNDLKNDNINTSDADYIRSLDIAELTTALNTYLNNGTSSQAKSNLNDKLDYYINSNIIAAADETRYTGNSGEDTRILMSDGNYLTAKGGKYGESNKYTGSTEYSVSSFAQHSKNSSIYFIPKNTYEPDITGKVYKKCDGYDANISKDEYEYENYGEGGGAGKFVCKLTGDINENSINPEIRFGSNNSISDNYCYAGLGGRGAGGAIIIRWN